jgi:hypothetical protein
LIGSEVVRAYHCAVVGDSFRHVKYQIVLAAVSAALLSTGLHAAGGSCLPRALTTAEKAMGKRVAAALLPLLPPAPPGWKIVDADHTDAASGTCLDSATKKMVPQPVSVLVSRKFMRTDPPAATPAAQPKPETPAAAPDANAEARAAALEQQINALKVKEQEASRAYTAARVKGDSEAQRKASQEAREHRAAQGPLQKELLEIRAAQRVQNNAASKASTDAAFARAKEELANRPVASVAILVNSDQASVRAAKVLTVPGVDLALRDSNGKSHLLFGKWKQFGSLAANPFDPSLPTTRVQDAIVDITGSDLVVEQLTMKLDLSTIRALIGR